MLNSPLATPNIQYLAAHPDGYVFAITSLNEVFRKDNVTDNWNKISVLDSTAYCISIDQNGILYIGTKGGYFYSTDNGYNWIPKVVLQPYVSIAYVSDIKFGSPNYIYLISYASNYSGVWISSDNGNSWNKYSNGLNGQSLMQLRIDSYGNFYVRDNYFKIFKSTDQGNNWLLLSSMSQSVYTIETDINGNIFISISGGIYKSSDMGNYWTKVYDNTNNPMITMIYAQNNYIYAIHFYKLGVIFSSNSGTTWQNIGPSNKYLNYIISTNNTIYIATEIGQYETTDFGDNWLLSFKYADKFTKINDLLILPNGDYLASTNEGLFRSFNSGGTWNETRITKSTRYVYEDTLNNILYALSDSIYKSTDFGETWAVFSNFGFSPVTHIIVSDSNYIFVSIGGNYVEKSTDQGNTWTTIFFQPGVYDISLAIYKIIQVKSGYIYKSYREWGVYHPGNIFVDNRYLRKNISGYTWSTVLSGKIVRDILVSDTTMYLATEDAGIFKSYDEGYTIIPISNGLTSNKTFKIIKTPEDVLICIASNGIYRSLSDGNYWVNLGLDGLLSTAINTIYYLDGILYACTDNGIGIFIGELPVELTSLTASLNQNKVLLNWETKTELNNNGFEVQRKLEGADWITIGFVRGNGTTTEPRNYTYLDDISEINSNKIYYRLKQIDFNGSYEFSKEVEIITLPSEYNLSQNYPNPFNPVTKIRFSIPTPPSSSPLIKGRNEVGFVTLKVYDILGNEVATLVNEYKPAGSYEVEFNSHSGEGQNISSGIYFYQLKADNFLETKKMILLK
jgi:photosystem II stability/assembly factor-like uncharacterized protein